VKDLSRLSLPGKLVVWSQGAQSWDYLILSHACLKSTEKKSVIQFSNLTRLNLAK
jgi:hypothetical protein